MRQCCSRRRVTTSAVRPDFCSHRGRNSSAAASPSRRRPGGAHAATVIAMDRCIGAALTDWRARWWPGDIGLVVSGTVLMFGLIQASVAEDAPAIPEALLAVAMAALLLARRAAPFVVLEG